MLTASTLLITSAYAQTAAEIALAQANIEITDWDAVCRGVTSGSSAYGSFPASNAFDKAYDTIFWAASGIANQFIVI